MRWKRRLKSERGQATILIGMMTMTFVLFLAFVINTGMLVNARINLQNAADMAAYAGAAVQARQLTHISLLNYEMRRHYKKFLFRYYVLGNMAQGDFPLSTAQKNGDYDFKPDASGTAYNVPAVCIAFNQNNNFCKLAKLKSTMNSSYSVLANTDLMNKNLIDSIKQIEVVRKGNCVSIGGTNKQILLLWLFNADPDSIANMLGTDPKYKETMSAIQVLSRGLGLIPRLRITEERIRTLTDYVRYRPEDRVNFESAQRFAQGKDAPARERTVQAFFSALRTLGNSTFPSGDVQMTEILPKGGASGFDRKNSGNEANLLKLKPIKVSFDTYALEFVIGDNCYADQGTAADAANTDAKGCTACPSPYVIRNITVGVQKDPEVLTYYAVKLTATARLLFSPFGNLKMSAYAAARPFGSRIGPSMKIEDPEEFVINKTNSLFCTQGSDCVGRIPNLWVGADGDSGWYSRKVLYNFYRQMWGTSGDPTPGMVDLMTEENLNRGLHASAVPSRWESGKYNIPMDLDGGLEFEHFFDSSGMMALWAPILGPESVGTSGIQDLLSDAITSIKQVAQGSSSKVNVPAFVESIKQQFNDYLEKLKKGQGEDGETMNVARFYNPLKTRSDNPTATPGNLTLEDSDLQLLPSDPSKIRTSWVSGKDRQISSRFRVGYSVKFVAFKSLRETNTNNLKNSAGAKPGNVNYSEFASDLNFINH